jgi:hypothetical protein
MTVLHSAYMYDGKEIKVKVSLPTPLRYAGGVEV